MPKPYDLTTHDGKTVDELTHAALLEVEKRLGYELTIVQGSYNAGGVSQSAGTHDGGGVVDLSAWDHENKVREMRRIGFAAWYRPTIPGLWNEHIHAVLMGNRKLSPSAAAQVDAYIAGRNGLANNGPDDGPRRWVDVRFSWRTGEKRIARAEALIRKAKATLSTGIRGYNTKATERLLGKAKSKLPDTQ